MNHDVGSRDWRMRPSITPMPLRAQTLPQLLVVDSGIWLSSSAVMADFTLTASNWQEELAAFDASPRQYAGPDPSVLVHSLLQALYNEDLDTLAKSALLDSLVDHAVLLMVSSEVLEHTLNSLQAVYLRCGVPELFLKGRCLVSITSEWLSTPGIECQRTHGFPCSCST